MADDKARWGGGTPPQEAFLERKRQALRKALRTEFIRQRYHPHVFEQGAVPIFDSAIQRFFSLRATRGEFKYPTLRNFTSYMALVIIPTALFVSAGMYRKRSFENRLRNGELAYDDEERKAKWVLSGF